MSVRRTARPPVPAPDARPAATAAAQEDAIPSASVPYFDDAPARPAPPAVTASGAPSQRGPRTRPGSAAVPVPAAAGERPEPAAAEPAVEPVVVVIDDDDGPTFFDVLLGLADDEEGDQEPDQDVAPGEPAAPRSRRASGLRRLLHRPPPLRLPVLRERFNRAAVGVAVLAVLAVVTGTLVTAVLAKTRAEEATAIELASGFTAPPAWASRSANAGLVVAVVGDGTATQSASGVAAERRWPALLAAAVGGRVSTSTSARGTGYATEGSSGATFVDRAADVPSNADVVVFVGGAADAGLAPLTVAKAATGAVAAAMQQAPDAKVVLVGPAQSGSAAAADMTTLRATLRSAARLTQARWVDPLAAAWLPVDRRGSASPTALTGADERLLAKRMQEVVRQALK